MIKAPILPKTLRLQRPMSLYTVWGSMLPCLIRYKYKSYSKGFLIRKEQSGATLIIRNPTPSEAYR